MLVSRRSARVFSVLVALGALSVWWHLTFDLATLSGLANPRPAPGGFAETLKALLPDVALSINQTYGLFGWIDAPSPEFAVLISLALGSFAFVLVVLGSLHRVRVAITVSLCVALCGVIPLAFSLTVGRQVGIHFWQARYTMPFGQGIALALGVLGAGSRGQPAELTALLRVARPIAWLLWPVLGTVAFVWALHRYVKGEYGDWSLGAQPGARQEESASSSARTRWRASRWSGQCVTSPEKEATCGARHQLRASRGGGRRAVPRLSGKGMILLPRRPADPLDH